MKSLSVFFFVILLNPALRAQEAVPARQLDFNPVPEGEGTRFSPVLPALMQKAGARPAYWEYFWEFGDGSFSFEEKPLHRYARAGDYAVLLDLCLKAPEAVFQLAWVGNCSLPNSTSPNCLGDARLKRTPACL